ncbi:MAG: hypothetical protein ACFFAU_16275 [Candidatus Hodarchaeota archaeon]
MVMKNILPLTKQYSYDEFNKNDNTPLGVPPCSYTIIIDPDYHRLEILSK